MVAHIIFWLICFLRFAFRILFHTNESCRVVIFRGKQTSASYQGRGHGLQSVHKVNKDKFRHFHEIKTPEGFGAATG